MRVGGVRRRAKVALFGAFAIIGVVLIGAGLSGCWAARPEVSATAVTTTVIVNASGESIGATNNQYIGLAFESDTLNSGKFDNVGDLAQMLKNLGSSVMRFGGNSVDKSFTAMTPDALAGLVTLAKASDWTVLYSEDLGKFDAASVTADARAVSAALGDHLSAFACGNEPNLFNGNGIRSPSYTEGSYLADATQCLAAIRAGAPNAPLEGPDFSQGSFSWLADYAKQESGKIAWLGQHYYPMGCGLHGKTPAQFAAELLSPALTSKEVVQFDEASADAKVADAPLWMSETNSACGGGAVGVSDSYATALWVVDYLLTGVEHGVSGFNFQGGVSTSCRGYTPLCQVGVNEYAAQPIYYGMLFTHLLGTGNLLPVTVSARPATSNITAFALRPLTGGGLRLIVENLSETQSNMVLQVGGHPSSATVLHLTGRSILAASGVRIQGAAVAANGSFAPGTPSTVRCSAGSCPVTIAPYSAALFTVG